jgi:cell division septation protein DedD
VFGLSAKAAAIGIAAAVALAAAIFVAGLGYGHYWEAKSADKTIQALKDQAAKREQDQLRELAAANDKVHDQEQAHAQEMAQLREAYAARTTQDAADNARMLNDLRSGTQQLRIAIAAIGHQAGSGTSGPATGSADGQADAQLAPEAAATLWGIAADGDTAISQLSALQDWSRSAVKLCNGTPESPKEASKP